MRKRQSKIIRANADKGQKIVAFTAAVGIQAASVAADGKPAGRPRFSITAYTGGPMSVPKYAHPVIVELAGFKTRGQNIPAFLDHNHSQIIGQSDKITINSDGVTIEGIITGEDANAQNVMANAKNGFQWQASIGANSLKEDFLPAGKTAVVNGRNVSGPVFISRAASLYEVSFTALGADPNTSASIAATGVSDMNFEKWLEAKGFDLVTIKANAKQLASLQAMFDAENAEAEGDEEEAPEPAKGKKGKKLSATGKVLTTNLKQIKAEHERSEAINAMAVEYARKHPNQIEMIEGAATTAIDDGVSPQDLELQLLRDCRATAPSNTLGHRDRQDLDAKVIEAAICMGGRLDNIEKKFKPETLEAAQQRWPHGLGLEDTLMIFAQRHGFSGGRRQTESLLRAAFQRDIQASGFSTISLPGILANVANKYLLEGYNGVETSWREIAAIATKRDFKTSTSYRMTGALQFEKVAPDGEIKHGTVDEQSFTNKVDTFGKMFAITRTDIINDDLGALTAIPRRIGRGGALALNNAVWAEFLDNSTFFTAGHANLLTGAGSALSSAGLKAAVGSFLKMTDPDGKPLGSMPTLLLVPPELAITADELFQSTNLNTGGSSTTDKVPNANVFRGKYRPIVSSYLSNAAYTGNSATAWYLLDNPNNIAVIEVAFLNGVQQPIVETAEADFNVLGIQMRGYFDFGVNLQDYRGGVKNAGV